MLAKKILPLILILLIFSCKLMGQYGGYIFSSFTNKDGLPDSKIFNVKEDKDGYIWVRTWNGVSFFDGQKFYTVKLTDEEGTSKINQISYELEDGSIWISNNRSAFVEYDKFQNQYTGKSMDSISKADISQHKNNSITFRDGRFFTKGEKSDTILNFNEFGELKNKKPLNFLLNNNDLWIYTRSSQLFIYNRKSGNLLEIPSRLWNYEITSLYGDRSGNVWLGTANGLMRAEKSNAWSLYQSNVDSITDERIFMVSKDRKGRVWAGGIDGKVFSYDSNLRLDKVLKIPHIQYSNPDRYLGRTFGMSPDEKDILWVSLKGDFSLFKININNFDVEPQKIRAGPEIKGSKKILRTIFIQNEDIWIGSYSSTLFKLESEDGTLSMFSPENHKITPPIWKILADRSNNLWLGTNCLRQFNQEEQSFTDYYLHPNAPHNQINYVFALYLEPMEKYLWVGSFGGGLHRFDMEKKHLIIPSLKKMGFRIILYMAFMLIKKTDCGWLQWMALVVLNLMVL